MIKFEKYSLIYLEHSSKWLNDPEIKFLTDTGDFTKEQQNKWFESLDTKEDYKIWGVCFENIPIGAFGVKNINYIDKSGEYWGYIGDKKYHGKGLGSIIMKGIIEKSITELGLKKLYLRVLPVNIAALSLYRKFGFQEIAFENEKIIMEKILI